MIFLNFAPLFSYYHVYRMRKILFAIIAFVSVATVISCNDTETYADKKKKEQSAINSFIVKQKITVITEDQFKNENYTTDLSKNEYVLMKNSGVYMQIIREGCGNKIEKGETTTVLCRFAERNLLTDSLQLTDTIQSFHYLPEEMTVTNNSGTFTASFISGSSLMYQVYQSTAVPSGWLIPLSYIKVGRMEDDGDEIAKVKLIVPHNQGHLSASNGVYPCFYEITYQRGR